ncbi:SelT/SelW/SelH family protein [Parapedobacter koreensis]|uniref:Selenoprotein W-related protein n=1 Tax=Parapedobacter koreensis TaxID=332977 RepID=A0A1H7JU36_9SPHI|nr:SelT/SelW/SelH family protein [Parapedobacter koreensis]SEK78089.1 selenoprotein W-related protein [Parapedobacter koreensis]
MKPTITIEYCPKCGWMLRSVYFASELLTTFTEELGGVLLKPSETAGRFTIAINETIIVDRKTDGGFPEITALKRLVRDRIAPDKQLGHTDKAQ